MTDKKTVSDAATKAADTAKDAAGAATDAAKNAVGAVGDVAGKGAAMLSSLVNIKGDKNVKKGEKLLAALAYFGFLCVLPLALKPQSKFCDLHGKQGLIIVVFFFVLGLLQQLIQFPPLVGFMFGVLQILAIVFGVMAAAAGSSKGMPFIGNMAKELEW